MSYRSPSQAHVPGSPFGKQIPDGPIHDLANVIEKTNAEDWQKRTQAFVTMVKKIPNDSYQEVDGVWHNTPATLRHLAWPLSELLKDPRSTVVKITCEACRDLFSRCQSNARYLLKDIMPTILGVHAQTVAVIRSAVQEMVLYALAYTPCKMAMPIWLDRLKGDKSRTVREACCLYLGTALAEWTEPGYLTHQIWEQVGTALMRSLRDSAQAVRQNAKKGLETVAQFQPDVFSQLLGSSELIRDARVKKILLRIQAGEVSDDISVASSRVGSVTSRSNYNRHGGGGGGSVSGGIRNGRPPPTATNSSSNVVHTRNSGGIPLTIGVTTPAQTRSASSSTVPRQNGVGLGPPIRIQAPFAAAPESPPKVHRSAPGPLPTSPTTNDTPDALPPATTLSTSFDTADTVESEIPVIASADALRAFAKSRGSSRRSSMLQERFAKSSQTMPSNGSDKIELNSSLDLDEILDNDAPETTAEQGSGVKAPAPAETEEVAAPVRSVVLPEHIRIAYELLEVHKKHVDRIMETLKVEMDALKEFELVLLEEGPERPTEDEVLEYFESVGLCVEQRAKAGVLLQKKMDKISKGSSST